MLNESNIPAVSTADPNHPALVRAREAAEFIAEKTGVEKHDLGLTLGSGWGEAATLIGEVTHTLDASEVPGFHKAAVVGHPGTLTSILTPEGQRAL